jgi:hypothetical protein
MTSNIASMNAANFGAAKNCPRGRNAHRLGRCECEKINTTNLSGCAVGSPSFTVVDRAETVRLKKELTEAREEIEALFDRQVALERIIEDLKEDSSAQIVEIKRLHVVLKSTSEVIKAIGAARDSIESTLESLNIDAEN